MSVLRPVRWWLGLLFLSLFPLPARAQDLPPITVTSASARYTFGQEAVFELEATAPARITAAYLYLQLEDEPRIEVYPVAVEPASTVRVEHRHDLHRFPFPPFGLVFWWWEVRDEEGHSLTTEPASLRYVDNRFSWVEAEAGPVRLHTVVNDPVYVQAALAVAQESLRRIADQLEVQPPDQIHLYIYASEEDLRAALEMAGREWVGGEAQPERDVILIAVPPDSGAMSRMERDIPHELTHILVYEAVGPEGYRYVPAWLDEGLATVNELRSDPLLEVALDEAWTEGRLISIRELCEPFSADPETALLSYAESASLVRYIREQYGYAGIRRLLAAYADGAGCEGGVLQALGVSLRRLELAWHADRLGLSGWLAWFADNRAWLLLWVLGMLAAIPLVRAVAVGGSEVQRR